MSFGRRFLKISGYVLGFLLVAGVAFHFWFKAHARQLIEDLVESRSNGKIRLKVDKFSFNWFSKKMEFEDAVFFSTDTSSASTAYRFSVKRIRLKVDAVLPIVFNKRIIIDTLTLLDPEIRVSRLRRKTANPDEPEEQISLPEEMGNVYNSIQDALQVLRVSRFLIDRGTFVLENRITPNQRPVVIDNIFFRIDNLSVDTTIRGAREKILFSDNVILRTHDQDIIFPDERHRLTFSKFNINLEQKLVEFDSCTIAALRTDSTAAAFTMYMDALKLIDIDFDTLYKAEVIKADSVYCLNPKFNLSVELGKKREGMGAPRLEDIIKQLTGDLLLDNVVVSNADFNIHTIKDGVPTSYSFTGNSFDMQGLIVDQDARSPIKVDKFAMAIRNYENFIRDSSYSVQFDSVLFKDDRIYLSNFVFHKLDSGRIVNSFNIPQFYLGGLSWDDLVFERKLKADQATLFYPRIDYTVSDRMRTPGGNNVFQSLASINEVMDLAYLDIIDGNIDLKVNKDVRIQLEQATLSIESYNLLQSTQLAGIKNSLTSLDFKNGIIHAGDITMFLNDIRYLGEPGRLTAGHLTVKDKRGNIDMDLDEVFIEKMLVDEKRGDILSENISWEKGRVHFKSSGLGKKMNSILEVSRVNGRNTEVSAEIGNVNFSTHVNQVSFDRLDIRPGTKTRLEGLNISGEDLQLVNNGSKLNADAYSLKDESQIIVIGTEYSNQPGSVSIYIPRLSFVPFISEYISGNYKIADLVLEDPEIEADLAAGINKQGILPQIDINSLSLRRPKIHYSRETAAGKFELDWDARSTSNALTATGLINQKSQGWDLGISSLLMNVSNLVLKTAAGKKFSTGQGGLEAELSAIRYKDTDQGADWGAQLKNLQARDILFDSSSKKKNRLHIARMSMRDLVLNQSAMTNLENLTRANKNFQVEGFTGSLENANTRLNWFNAVISRPGNLFRLDSLRWAPHLSPDSFLARQVKQKDYVSLRTGAMELQNADIESFMRDNTIAGSTLNIKDLDLAITRDTRLPRDSGRTKPLPVDLFRKIQVPLQVAELVTKNGRVNYTEIGASGDAVSIPITKLDANLGRIKNYDLHPADSFYTTASAMLLDSIRISLQLVESYQDSIGGFRMHAGFGPSRMQVLNPATVPLGGIYIRSGVLDTAHLSVRGNEYMAFGEMNMEYSDLKVQLLKEGAELHRKNTKGFLSFLANTFVIRNNSNGKPAIIFVTRNREKSIFNYLVKIATRGFQTGIGVGRNRKLTREYEKQLKESGTPDLRKN